MFYTPLALENKIAADKQTTKSMYNLIQYEKYNFISSLIFVLKYTLPEFFANTLLYISPRAYIRLQKIRSWGYPLISTNSSHSQSLFVNMSWKMLGYQRKLFNKYTIKVKAVQISFQFTETVLNNKTNAQNYSLKTYPEPLLFLPGLLDAATSCKKC